MASILQVNELPPADTVDRAGGDIYKWFQTHQLVEPFDELAEHIDHGYWSVDPDMQWVLFTTEDTELPVEFLETLKSYGGPVRLFAAKASFSHSSPVSTQASTRPYFRSSQVEGVTTEPQYERYTGSSSVSSLVGSRLSTVSSNSRMSEVRGEKHNKYSNPFSSNFKQQASLIYSSPAEVSVRYTSKHQYSYPSLVAVNSEYLHHRNTKPYLVDISGGVRVKLYTSFQEVLFYNVKDPKPSIPISVIVAKTVETVASSLLTYRSFIQVK
jgi:hypothetical protein